MLLHAVHRELDRAVDAGAAFEALFGAHEVAVWLDSSRAEPGLARVSVLAAGEGPLAEVLRYRVGEDAVEVTRDGVTTAEPGSVLDALRRRAATHRLDDVPPVPVDVAGG
ncbi:MAG: aminodeoxychorismate synthase component I, partial [Actinomycetota bacterium]